MATEQANYRFPEGLRAQITKRAEQEGVTATEIVVKALRAYLNGDMAIADPSEPLSSVAIRELASRIETLENELSGRIEILETAMHSASESATPAECPKLQSEPMLPEGGFVELAPEQFAEPCNDFEFPPEIFSGESVANGHRFLTTEQALYRAKERGGRWVKENTFHRWAQHNSDELLEQFGMRMLENPSKTKPPGNFEDVWYQETWL